VVDKDWLLISDLARRLHRAGAMDHVDILNVLPELAPRSQLIPSRVRPMLAPVADGETTSPRGDVVFRRAIPAPTSSISGASASASGARLARSSIKRSCSTPSMMLDVTWCEFASSVPSC
jgi:hypothetical protein